MYSSSEVLHTSKQYAVSHQTFVSISKLTLSATFIILAFKLSKISGIGEQKRNFSYSQVRVDQVNMQKGNGLLLASE
jgi:hypothetical protein